MPFIVAFCLLSQFLQTLTTYYTGQAAFVLNYGYDAGSRVTSVTDGDGVSVGTQYDQRNNVSQITWQGTGIAACANFTHDPIGDLTNIKRYADTASANLIGQVTLSHARNLPNIGYQAAAYNSGNDQTPIAGFAQTEASGPLKNDANTASLWETGTQPLSRLSEVAYQDGSGNILLSEGYTNDSAGQLTGKTVGSDAATYGYDQTGQLLSVVHSVNNSANESYAYDAGGNRTKTGLQSTSNSVAASNRITADTTYSYTYDNEGNLVTKTTAANGQAWAYSYDLRNRLTSATLTDSGGNLLSQVNYIYDILDRRIAKIVNGLTTQYFYNGDNLWKQINVSGTTRFLTGGADDQWLARSNSAGVNWYLTDRLGSVVGITDVNGNLICSTTYDSYGHILSQTNPPVADQFAFTGREFDSETGLYYLRARYYNPDLGRFQSEDTIGFRAGDYNINRYCFNSPENNIDPSGNAVLSESEIIQTQEAVNETIVRCFGQAALTTVGKTTAQFGIYILLTDLGFGYGDVSNTYVGSAAEQTITVRIKQQASSFLGGRGLTIIKSFTIPLNRGELSVSQIKQIEQIVINAFGGRGQLLNWRQAQKASVGFNTFTCE